MEVRIRLSEICADVERRAALEDGAKALLGTKEFLEVAIEEAVGNVEARMEDFIEQQEEVERQMLEDMAHLRAESTVRNILKDMVSNVERTCRERALKERIDKVDASLQER